MTSAVGRPVLFLCQVLPYPEDAGPKVRAYGVLSKLAEWVPVHLLCFTRPTDPPWALDHLRDVCAVVETVPIVRSRLDDAATFVRSIVVGQSGLVRRDITAPMLSAVSRRLARTSYAAVHADQLAMAAYVGRTAAGTLRVFDNHNAVFKIVERLAVSAGPWQKLLLRREAPLVARWEVAQHRRFDAVVYVTDVDRRAVQAWTGTDSTTEPQADVSVIPICVDVPQVPRWTPRASVRQVTILGTMYWPPNVEGARWFLEQVWPLVNGAVPDARLSIVGRNPPAGLMRAATSAGPSVTLTGYLPVLDDLLADTAVLAVPLLSGGGMRVKIVEAWAKGLSVVSTSTGAEGLAVEPDRNIVLADRGPEMASEIIRLLGDVEARRRLARAGHATALQFYDRTRVYGAWRGVYAPVL